MLIVIMSEMSSTSFELTYSCDILSSSEMLIKLEKKYNIKITDDNFDLKNIKNIIPNDICNENDESKFTKMISLNKIEIGDIVLVKYSPYSQSYIDEYDNQKFIGRVFYIDIENDDALLYFDCEGKRTIKSLERDHCSYYGESRGYDYTLFKMNEHPFKRRRT